MPDNVDKILQDIEADRKVRQQGQASPLPTDGENAVVDRILEERKNKVSGFKLDLDLDEEIPDSPPVPESTQSADAPEVEQSTPPVREENIAAPVAEREEPQQSTAEPVQESKKSTARPKKKLGWLRGLIYVVVVLGLSGILAYFAIVGGIDLTGLNKSDVAVPVTLTEEQCKSTAQVAKVLKQAGVIDQPLVFRLYCKVSGADGKFQPQQEAALSPDMGYRAIVNTLRTSVREIVTLTFPEGLTIKDIAAKLEDNRICSVSDFYLALNNSDSYGYDFFADVPDDANRYNRLEGYIFPDTYDFYVGSSGETVVRKFLDAFNQRVDITMRTAIKAKGMTLDEVVTLASMIEWEAASKEDMYKVSAVLHNRLDNASDFPRLQCDSTRRYINSIWPPVDNVNVENEYYDTYKCTGLPVGPINNPGLSAIKAAMEPDEAMKGYYFFAVDPKTGKTYYGKTLKEHENYCRRYNIGMYASN